MDPKTIEKQSDFEKEVLKSMWQDRHPDAKSFICPLCKRPRRISSQLEPGSLNHYFAIGFSTVIFTIFTWPWFEWKGIVAFLPFWMTFEVLYRWRMRALLICADCGFDPFLMKTDIKLAQREVDTHWRKKFSDRGIPYPEKKLLRKRNEE